MRLRSRWSDWRRSAASSKAIGGSTARRYARFGERLIARLGSLDLRDLEDVAELVTAWFRDGRARDPTIDATVLLRSVMRAAPVARDVRRPHPGRIFWL